MNISAWELLQDILNLKFSDPDGSLWRKFILNECTWSIEDELITVKTKPVQFQSPYEKEFCYHAQQLKELTGYQNKEFGACEFYVLESIKQFKTLQHGMKHLGIILNDYLSLYQYDAGFGTMFVVDNVIIHKRYYHY